MNLIYHYFGVCSFWLLVLFLAYVIAGYIWSLIVDYKERFWAYQIYERIKGGKKIKELLTRDADEIYYPSIKFHLLLFSEKNSKQYRKGFQLFRKWWIKNLQRIMDRKPLFNKYGEKL